MIVKEELFNYCHDFVAGRIEELRRAIESARESANDDTKSSAGDKFETSREMLQQEVTRNLTFLAEAERMKADLEKLTLADEPGEIKPGCLAETDMGNFYIAISAGKIVVQGKEYFAMSIQSPLGQVLKGRKATDTFEFRGVKHRIVSVS
jgi:hypothetical protein